MELMGRSMAFLAAYATISNSIFANNQESPANASPMKLCIIVGSTRPTETGKAIAKNIKRITDKRPEVAAEIVEVAKYKLPFYAGAEAPQERKNEITDPALRAWSTTIEQAEGYIIVAPEYNGGYTAPLKNALDSLYKEWNHKPVAFVGYSGGSSGGQSMIAQLTHVVRCLKMSPVATNVMIPTSWKALDANGRFLSTDAIEQTVNNMIDQLLRQR